MENKDAVSFTTITYFNNDADYIMEIEMEEFVSSPLDCYESNGVSLEDVVGSVISYLKEEKLEDTDADTKAREIIRSMGSMLDFDENRERDKIVALFYVIKGTKCFEKLYEEYENMLWNDDSFIAERIDFCRDDVTERLREDGFTPETYIILGSKMGWRHKSGYKITYLRDERDMENAVTGDYDYSIEISRISYKAPYLEARVSTHDNPMGEHYIFIPVKNLEEALKYPEVKDEYEKFRYLIEMDLTEAETA